jgi:glycosyltransferase involved in cell wall biosynthesis
MHTKTTGDIIVYMDDDDYYPPERISHAVEMLNKNPEYEFAGSSILHICFIDLMDIYKFGPYNDLHATAATFAFRRSHLEKSKFDNSKEFAEERSFLNDHTTKVLQLDPYKTIFVLSHDHSTCDKYKFINGEIRDDKHITKLGNVTMSDFIKNKKVYDIVSKELLGDIKKYDLGTLKYKPDVIIKQQEFMVSHISRIASANEKNCLYLKHHYDVMKSDLDKNKKVLEITNNLLKQCIERMKTQEKQFNARILQLEVTQDSLK